MRRAARTDGNHAEIMEALRKAGASVKSAHAVGMGFPDLVVGFRGKNHLLEVKDGSLSPSRRRLTEMEQRFHDQWGGHCVVVNSAEEALRAIGAVA